MTKILLVEDDKSLREIYGVRLLAEGYQIASAGDGEEALAMAVKERPDLIIADVMMPKISGFDMLDILRSTPETKEIKVIMMTALSSEDQRARGEALGANRYLVKSQVGIEDVVRTVHDVLADSPIAVAPVVQPFGTPAASTIVSPPPMSTPKPLSASPTTTQPFATTTTTTTTTNPMTQSQMPTASTIPVQTTTQVTPQSIPVTTPPVTESSQMPQPTAPFSSPIADRSTNPAMMTPDQDIANRIAQELSGTPVAPQPPIQ